MRSFISRVIRKICRLIPRPVKYTPVYIPVFESSLLKGRKALITGATGGIGLAIAESFLKAGASVIIAGRSPEKIKGAVGILSKLGQVDSCVIDMQKPETYVQTITDLDSFDILINNAGYVGGGLFGATEISEYDKVLQTNLRGAYFLSQAVSRKWIDSGVKGNILNICSASSLRPGNSPYILSKWGLRSLTVGMARDLIKHGIVVNGLGPGCTNTVQFCSSERSDINNQSNPSHRLVTTQEIANLAVVMVSSLTRMVVGDVLYVTGGAAITTFDD